MHPGGGIKLQGAWGSNKSLAVLGGGGGMTDSNDTPLAMLYLLYLVLSLR